jgi:hypothetical protein
MHSVYTQCTISTGASSACTQSRHAIDKQSQHDHMTPVEAVIARLSHFAAIHTISMAVIVTQQVVAGLYMPHDPSSVTQL